jgi:Xaa-Pro aminopeptidase
MNIRTLAACFLLLQLSLSAQPIPKQEPVVSGYRYESDWLSKEFHAGRRTALRNEMPPNSVAVFFSNPVRNRSNDVDYDYHQDPNFYYLTGHTEPNSVVFIFKENTAFKSFSGNEALFIEERLPNKETWTGRLLGTKDARMVLGFDTVLSNSELASFPIKLDSFNKILIAPLEKVDDAGENKDLSRLQLVYLKLLGERGIQKQDASLLQKIMTQLREVKEKEELLLLRKAIDISCKAHIELIKSVQTNIHEYEAQSIVEYMFKSQGAEFEGYPTIAGGGENTCVLHYTTNRKKLENNQLLLCDAGAEYHGYTADVTRTIPVDGVFSAEERALYEIILAAQEAGINECKADNSFYAPHTAAVKVIKEGLLKLGIIKNEKEYRNYFPHGTSHYLGLDVHDVGSHGPLKSGSVITVEPGIYIPEGADCDSKWWNIGIRIEDDILITTGEPENLSAKIPKKIEEIEALMKTKGAFEK